MTDLADSKDALPKLTVEQAAKMLRKSTRQVRTYLSRQDDPLPSERGKGRKPTMIPLQDLHEWAVRRQLAELTTLDTGETLDPRQERALLDRARRALAEQELERRSGRLLDWQQVYDDTATTIVAARSRLLSLPTALAPVVAGETEPAVIENLIRARVYEALDELSRPDEWWPEPDQMQKESS